MPLVTAAVTAYAVGLLLGFGGAFRSVAVVGACVVLLCLALRRQTIAALALLAIAGAAVARSTAARDAHCLLAAARASSWIAVLDDDATAGGFARLELRTPGCALRGAAFVARGRVPAGATVRLGGALLRDGHGGVVVREASVARAEGRAPLAALRAAAGRAIDSTFRSDAALARALLVADTRSLSPELRDRFAAAGLVHVLSISGLHVSVIAGVLLLVFRALRLRAGMAGGAAVATTALYVAMIGGPPPAVRAAAMLASAAAGRALGRHSSPWASLAVGAALPLALDARAVTDLGFQLSVAGMASLVASGSLARRLLAPRADGWRLTVGRELLTSVVATLVTAPLVAWAFGRVSLVAPLTNLAAAPIVALLQPALFLALLVAPVSPAAARLVADGAHPLMAALDAVAGVGASVPYAALAVSPSIRDAVIGGAAALALVVACVSRFPARPLALCLALAALAAWSPARLLPAREGGAVELVMLDVGQGDAVAIRTDRGRWLLFDAGRIWARGDAGRATVVPYIRRRGGPAAAFVLSHPHADHVGGGASVIAALHPGAFYDAAFAAGSEVYRAALTAAREEAVPWRRVHPGDSLVVDGVVVSFLGPDSTWTAHLTDPNLASTIASVRFGAVRFLLVGDAERAEEEWLLSHAPPGSLRADVLKVGHHGSRTSSGGSFLDAVRPRLALVSVGAANGYGHPSAEVMADLAARGVEVLRTDRLGTIVVRTDGAAHTTITADGTTWPIHLERGVSDTGRAAP